MYSDASHNSSSSSCSSSCVQASEEKNSIFWQLGDVKWGTAFFFFKKEIRIFFFHLQAAPRAAAPRLRAAVATACLSFLEAAFNELSVFIAKALKMAEPAQTDEETEMVAEFIDKSYFSARFKTG